VRDDFDAAVFDAPCGRDAIRNGTQLIGTTTHDDHLQAIVVGQVDVQAATDSPT
jgi:hypothetical protein